MTSILLNSLSGTNSNNLNNNYCTNIENNMNRIEREQAFQSYANPEYLKQFDDLKFDNSTGPVSINQNNIGVNNSLQRNIDFVNGYSEFQKNDMHYNVVSSKDFVHNNMVPNTSTRDRDILGSDRNQRTLETFTGNSDFYTPKTEQYHLFEPMTDLTFTTGMPTITSKIQNRYIPSNKNNNGNLPFENNVRVRPGVENKNQGGNYAVYRVNPLNVDQLRSQSNQKIVYNNKPLETIKKGEIRGPDFKLSKFKIPDFKEKKFSDLVPSKSIYDGPIQTGVFTDMNTLRNQKETYNPGPANHGSTGEGPNLNKIKFQQAKKESYLNDPTHAINAVNSKLVLTNIDSYTNYNTQRASTNSTHEGPLSTIQTSYTVDYNDIPLVTQRQLMLYNENNLGAISQIPQNYIFSNDMILPTTNRNTMKNQDILGSNPQEKQVNTQYQDEARATGRMFTSHNITGTSAPQEKQVNTQYQDEARATGRMFTSHNITGASVPQEKQVNTQYQDEARATGRMFTSHNITGTSAPQEKQVNTQYQDEARATGRMFTSHSITGTSVPQEKQVNTQFQDEARATGRMFTSHSITGTSVPQEKQVNTQFQDEARATGRMFTSHSITGTSVPQEKQVNTQYQDEAKVTGRMFTSHSITGTSVPQEKQVNTQFQDEAKVTGRMFTSHSITGTSVPQEKQVNTQFQDEAKVTGRMFTSHSITGTSVPQEKQVNTQFQDEAKVTGRMFTSHSITGTSVPQEKQVNTQFQDEAKVTGRMFTSHNITGTSVPQEKQVNTQFQDEAKVTGRMFTSHSITGTSVPQEKQVNTQYQDQAKITGRMSTSHNITGSSVSQDKLAYTKNNDIAKPTIKQSTLINDPVANISNSNNVSNYSRDINNIAKITVRQQTEVTEHIGSIKNNINDANYVIDNNYNAKATIKQTTIAPTPLGREFNADMGNYTRDEKDNARNTIRQTTEVTEYVGGIKSEVDKKISHEATNNIELDDRREISTYNRTANGKKDLNGPYINRENVELNDPLLYSYVPNPHIALDHSIMPTVPKDIVEKVYIRAKPVVQSSSYYINDCFINTLADNPLVNDIYHPKNI